MLSFSQVIAYGEAADEHDDGFGIRGINLLDPWFLGRFQRDRCSVDSFLARFRSAYSHPVAAGGWFPRRQWPRSTALAALTAALLVYRRHSYGDAGPDLGGDPWRAEFYKGVPPYQSLVYRSRYRADDGDRF